jgi:hypothetical protein
MVIRAYDRLTRQLIEALDARLRRRGRPPVPEAGRLLWNAFHELSRGRTWNQVGPNPVAMTEIEAWSRMARLPLKRRHVAVILALDEAFLAHAMTASAPVPEGTKAAPVVSPHGITAALFDLTMG